jgi:hypothetical protein
MVNTFPAKRKIIKDNVLTAEAIQTKNKTGINLRTIRMRIKGMQVPDNSSKKK